MKPSDSRQRLKKARERWQVEIFKKSYLGFPAGEIVEGESPDFTVGPIAIELTELFVDPSGKGSRAKASESHEQGLIRHLYLHCQRFDLPPLWISLHFKATTKSSNAKAVAHILCEIIAKNIPDVGASTVLYGDVDGLPKKISRLSISRPKSLKRLSISPVRAGFVGQVRQETIQDAVFKKKGKVQGQYAERWLVLVMEGFAPSSMIELSEDAPACEYQSDFDRVFILECFSGKVLELKVVGFP